ncbi:cytochrome P450 81Q32-like [Carex rostrata]
MDNIFSFQTILLTVAILFVIKTLFSIINKNSNRKLPPSPPALPVLGHLHLLKPPLHQALVGISNRYGPATLLRFGSRPALIISSHTLAEQCFTTHDVAFANQPQLPSVMLPNLIGMANYGSYWRNVRQIAAVELLANQRLQASSDFRAREVRDMARQLFQSYNQTERSGGFGKLQLKNFLFELMLNVTMMMIAGRRLCGDNVENLEEMKRYKEAVEGWFELSGGANIEDFVPIFRMLDLKGVLKRMRVVTDVNEMMAQKLIDEHKHEGAENRETMIARMLDLQKDVMDLFLCRTRCTITVDHRKPLEFLVIPLKSDEESERGGSGNILFHDPEKYSNSVIRNVCISLLLGGSETSTTTLAWAMANLLNSPYILKKAVSEIDAHVGNERLIEESDMTNLPYLQHILNETLRIYPIGPLLLPHESSKEVTIGDYEIPPGTMILVNVYQIQRSPEIWDEPTKFKPERFEKGNADEKWMIPFGMGRRRCPGEALAMRKMFLVLGTLIQCFDWERVGDKLVDMTEGAGLTLPMAVPLEALYRPRKAMIKVLSEL